MSESHYLSLSLCVCMRVLFNFDSISSLFRMIMYCLVSLRTARNMIALNEILNDKNQFETVVHEME